eukprot:7348338-Alexandrium_andersonii.AAC.1
MTTRLPASSRSSRASSTGLQPPSSMGAGAPWARLPPRTGCPRTPSPAGPAVGPSPRSSDSRSA